MEKEEVSVFKEEVGFGRSSSSLPPLLPLSLLFSLCLSLSPFSSLSSLSHTLTHNAVPGAVDSVPQQPRRPLHAPFRCGPLDLPLLGQLRDVGPELLLGVEVERLRERAQHGQGLVAGQGEVVGVGRSVVGGSSSSKQEGQRALDRGRVRGRLLDGAPPVGAPAPAKGRGEELVAWNSFFIRKGDKRASGESE